MRYVYSKEPRLTSELAYKLEDIIHRLCHVTQCTHCLGCLTDKLKDLGGTSGVQDTGGGALGRSEGRKGEQHKAHPYWSMQSVRISRLRYYRYLHAVPTASD